MTDSGLPQRWNRLRDGIAAHEGALDLLVLGALALAALCFHLYLAETYTPVMNLAVGPDQDDWWGVFQGVQQGWPFKWDGEWAFRLPLVPLLAFPVASALDAPLALAFQMLAILLGSMAPAMTWVLGRQALGRSVALAAALWILIQPVQASATVMTTAYSLITPLYLLLLLGIVRIHGGRRGSRALVFGISVLIVMDLVQGAIIVLYTMGAYVAAALLLRRTERPGIKLLALNALPGLAGVVAGIGLLTVIFPHVESPLWGSIRRILHEMSPTADMPPLVNQGIGYMTERLTRVTRVEHFLMTLEELFLIHRWLVVAGLALGLVALAARRSHAHGFTRLLLLAMVPILAFNFITNNGVDHWFHWFPVMGLILVAGLVSPLGHLPRIGWLAQWVVSIALIAWWASTIHQAESQRPVRSSAAAIIDGYYQEVQRNVTFCGRAFAPIRQGGSLFTDDMWIFGLRGALRGNNHGRVLDINSEMVKGGRPRSPIDLRRYDRPWFLATSRPSRKVAGAFSPIPSFTKGVRLKEELHHRQYRPPYFLYGMELDEAIRRQPPRPLDEAPIPPPKGFSMPLYPPPLPPVTGGP